MPTAGAKHACVDRYRSWKARRSLGSHMQPHRILNLKTTAHPHHMSMLSSITQPTMASSGQPTGVLRPATTASADSCGTRPAFHVPGQHQQQHLHIKPFYNSFLAAQGAFALAHDSRKKSTDLLQQLETRPITSAVHGTIVANAKQAMAEQEGLLVALKGYLDVSFLFSTIFWLPLRLYSICDCSVQQLTTNATGNVHDA